jgi:hypothetical protein
MNPKIDYEIIVKSLNNDNEYIIEYSQELLPDWQSIPKTVIFLFFKSKLPLNGSNLSAENLEKDRLLLQFNRLGKKFYSLSKNHDILTEIICPKTGFPQYSTKGNQIFITQQLVKRYLPLFQVKSGECGLIHPSWSQAVYPCLIISSASITEIKPIISLIF